MVALGSEAHKFNVAIPLAEQRYLRPLVGTVLFEALLGHVQAGAPANAALTALASEVKDMLSTWAVVEAWPSLLGHIEAAGFTTKVGEKTTSTSTADVLLTDRQLASLRETAAWQSAELTRWLTARATNYPTWQTPGGQASTEMPLGGLYLD